jgi:hypothetical protein
MPTDFWQAVRVGNPSVDSECNLSVASIVTLMFWSNQYIWRKKTFTRGNLKDDSTQIRETTEERAANIIL